MEVSLISLKALVEKKIRKKLLVKIMWNDTEKITLFITPNMKINSFLYDDNQGYLFYDNEGKLIKNDIPCILLEEDFKDGKVKLKKSIRGKLLLHDQPLSEADILFLKELS